MVCVADLCLLQVPGSSTLSSFSSERSSSTLSLGWSRTRAGQLSTWATLPFVEIEMEGTLITPY